MYPKVKTVRRGGRSYEYLELVEGRREGGRVRQRVVANLGRLDELVAGGQLEALAAGLARLHQPPPGTRRHVGPLLIVAHYLDALGVAQIVDEVIPRRGRALAGHGEIAAVLAASRLCSPSPLYDIAGWASSAAVAELLGVPAALLNDDRLGRSLEALAPAAADVRGRLLLAAVRGFAVADASRLHLDLTAVRFTGSYAGSALVEKGWSADRTIARQVKTVQATVPAGVPVYFRPHHGAAGEPPAFMAAIEELAAALPPGLVIVADSGLGHLENLCAADAANVRFVVPLRADTGWADRFTASVDGGLAALAPLDYASWRERHLPPSRRTRWTGLLAPFPVTSEDGTVHELQAAYIWSSEEAASVAAARERALAKAEAALTRIRNGLGGRYYKTKKQVDARVAQILKVRPVFLHNDDRIQALIAVIGIALLIFGLIEAELRAALGDNVPLPGILPEGRAAKPTARAVLAAFDGLHLTYTPAGIVLDRLTQVQRTILALLDIPPPWPEKPA